MWVLPMHPNPSSTIGRMLLGFGNSTVLDAICRYQRQRLKNKTKPYLPKGAVVLSWQCAQVHKSVAHIVMHWNTVSSETAMLSKLVMP